ncbi:MAG TPA: sigma-70 family RNA polymerase sigma factor [Vicinamibacterales bacterium]|nr:sigma-70 family RNA polymerase sigma factor [Vicinamibacterales bacterium]
MASAETAQLFERVRGGAPGALDAFYERCARKLLPLIRLRMGRTLRSELESRDVLQAVLLKSWPRLDHVQDPQAVMAWLARIAENEIRDQADYRQRQRRDAARRTSLDDAADVPAPVRQALSQAIANEQMARIEEALESMPAADRDIIVLRKLEELPFAAIGARLGKSEDACRMAFARAMASLTLRVSNQK